MQCKRHMPGPEHMQSAADDAGVQPKGTCEGKLSAGLQCLLLQLLQLDMCLWYRMSRLALPQDQARSIVSLRSKVSQQRSDRCST